MNTERTIILENVADQPIGLKDTQQRTYRLQVGARIRISQVSLQDILDYPASKVIFKEGMAKIKNVTAECLYNMGLTEDEIELFTNGEYEQPAVVITEDLKEDKEVIPVKKPATKKATTTKKTTTKKTSSKSAK